MKNRIYTSLLFGISIAFSITGHTQTKSVKKPTTTKTISATPSKTTDKKSTVAVKSNQSNKKTPALPAHSTEKKTATLPKQSTVKKVVETTKANTKNQPIVSAKQKNNKQLSITKSAEKKQTSVASNKKNDKQTISSPKLSQKTKDKDIASIDSSTRKHTVISSKSIESTSVKLTNYKKSDKNASTDLDLENTESDPVADSIRDKAFRPIPIDRPQPKKINTAHVSIETSLFLDGLEADLSKELILQLTEIFAWDIDFATNLRPGDEFTVVYGKKMVGGKETDIDEIIAAEFINQGRPYTAVRYVDESGIASYYTPDGQSMQRAFLSAPVDFIKISSPFDMHRKHPILNRIRAHKGIDYAARTGTPVKTTGDGIVTFCGRNGAYGQVVIIEHNDHYETLYAHLSDFKKGLTVGDHVKQGDVIGYVGQSGLATGPHLHYEFHVDGIYRDPETVKIPHSMPISNELLADFKAQTQTFVAQLNQAKAQSLFAETPPAIVPSNALPPSPAQPSHFD
ncbi:peptidoglycan DD-metalloendopeptidase family protein [Candidatus Methylobacter oryzae]|uniref:Peptidoglycan DD-metalloendopeptidase family protein n=1 Tax=Candidatus Methylobacter oryzae TaxID=2497749 RepID=A0ABY3CAW8_9GAMM|nr:peptidoglycan DD-metalloendopeptidase family protein [Candidatus Methylobacter oryzae]TRW95818.1 peptidoglycan DD-metalloendopeptidase family protein [Candidatus Methylobacter oryzae]